MNTTTKEALIEFTTAAYTAILGVSSTSGGVTREELKRLRDANAALRKALAMEEVEVSRGEEKSPF